MTKIIVCDLDSTLLNDDKKITKYSMNIIDRARKLGFYFVVSTARPKDAVNILLPNLIVDGGIYQNGAHILHLNGDEEYRILDEYEVHNTINLLTKNDICNSIAIESLNGRFSNFDTTYIWKDVHFKRTDFKSIYKDVLKILLVDASGNSKEIETILKGSFMKLSIAENTLGMITHPIANKLRGLKCLLEKENFDIDDVVAFGDDLIDIDLLKESGIGVAVANANQNVKDVADYITLSNNEDGVCVWISNYLLK